MDKLKSLLLPLAIVFGAIAVFQTGARYGATTMRAYAIIREMQLPIAMYVDETADQNTVTTENLAVLIDQAITSGVKHRQIWYLNKQARLSLDQALVYALSVRGDALEEWLRAALTDDTVTPNRKAVISEILAALEEAKTELAEETSNSDDTDTAE